MQKGSGITRYLLGSWTETCIDHALQRLGFADIILVICMVIAGRRSRHRRSIQTGLLLCGFLLNARLFVSNPLGRVQTEDSASRNTSQTATSVMGVTEARLDNGLKVLLKEIHNLPLVSVWCWYRVGSKDESPGRTGMSRWTELMSFKGTSGLSKEQMKNIVEDAGGYSDGHVSLDQTAYFETVPSDGLENVLKLEAERMTGSSFDPAEVNGGRALLASQVGSILDKPKRLLDFEVTAAALRVHPYRWSTIGWVQDLEGITRDQLYHYYRTYYIPNNAVLVIVGDFGTQSALTLVKKHFGSIPRKPDPVRIRTLEPKQEGERRIKIAREGSTAYLQIAFRAPDILNDEFYALLLLDTALTGARSILWSDPTEGNAGKSSRLYRALADKRLATCIHSCLTVTQDPFLYKLVMTLPNGFQYQPAEEAIYDELDRLKYYGLSDQELAKVKNQWITKNSLDQDSVTKLAYQLGYFESVASFRVLESFEEKIQLVSKEDLRRTAIKYFSEKSRTVGWFVPERKEQRIDVEKLAQRRFTTQPLAELSHNRGERLAHERAHRRETKGNRTARPSQPELHVVALLQPQQSGGPGLPAGALKTVDGRTRWRPPAIGLPWRGPVNERVTLPITAGREWPSSNKARVAASVLRVEQSSATVVSDQPLPKISIGPQRKVSPQGVTIAVVENTIAPTVRISAAMKAGAVRDTDAQAGVAQIVGRMLERGTRLQNVHQLAESFEFLGAQLRVETDYLLTTLTVDALRKDAQHVIQLLADMLRSPAFPAGELDQVKAEVLAELSEDSDDPRKVAEQALRERIYPPGHPFRRMPKGTAKSIEKLRSQDLMSFYKRFYRPDQLLISVSGDVKSDDIFQFVEKSFTGWVVSGAPEAFSIPPASPGLGAGQQVVKMSNVTQCELAFGFPAISIRHPDYYAMVVLNQIFGQAGRGGRIGRRLTDQEKVAYSVSSHMGANLAEAPFLVHVTVAAEQVDRAIAVLKEEIQQLNEKGITETEVTSAKRHLIRALPTRMETNQGIVGLLEEIELYQLGQDYLNQYAGLVSGVQLDRVTDCSRSRLRFDQGALIVAGPYEAK